MRWAYVDLRQAIWRISDMKSRRPNGPDDHNRPSDCDKLSGESMAVRISYTGERDAMIF